MELSPSDVLQKANIKYICKWVHIFLENFEKFALAGFIKYL